MDWKEKVQVSCKDAAHKISEHTSLHYNFLIVHWADAPNGPRDSEASPKKT